MSMFPTPVMRLRQTFGRCSSCWAPSDYRVAVSSQDGDGNTLKTINLKACRRHADEHVAAITKVPHSGTAQIDGIGEVRWAGLGSGLAALDVHDDENGEEGVWDLDPTDPEDH